MLPRPLQAIPGNPLFKDQDNIGIEINVAMARNSANQISSFPRISQIHFRALKCETRCAFHAS